MSGWLRLHTWDLIHRWSSVVCTLFLLMLCLTGLPLIFHHEINEWLGHAVRPLQHRAGAQHEDLDLAIASAREHFQGRPVLFASHEPDDPLLWFITMGPSHADKKLVQAAVDASTGSVIAEPAIGDIGVMGFLLALHVRMFLGLGGELLLGTMGLITLLSIMSGLVLYGPFMRELSFGEIRRQRGPRIRRLDLHNLTGMATLTWLTVVVATGAVNSFSTPILNYWQSHQIRAMTSAYSYLPAVSEPQNLEKAVQGALQTESAAVVSFVAFPGSSFSSPYHYGVYIRGNTPATSHLPHVVFVDARSGVVTAVPELPWYIVVLALAEPLHFGDYGGLGLKWVWAVLDMISIAVLVSGLYLWLARRSRVRARRAHAGPAGARS
jgi:uncharacterized iron-regulated membrane protein